MQKNVTGQKWVVFAFDTTDLSVKTGDSSNITANLRIDGGGANAVDDTNPTELEDGYYIFDITQPETNGDLILICPESSTGNIQVIGVPGAVYTTPPNFPSLGIESDGDVSKVNELNGQTVQTADHTAAIATAQADLDIITGSDGTTLATAQGNYAPSKAGDLMGLSADAITAAKFDESTAFPVKSADTGATEIARTGADGDTLETISDQLDAVGGGGPGDNEVTVTIRTVGGTPISGVSVWVNSANTRSVSVAGTKVTGTNGQVTFNLEYTTYYVFCHLSTYTFASASFTAAAGSVSFIKDIGTALSGGVSSDYDESFISRSIVNIREDTDEPTVNAKYTDARIIQLLEKAYILVVNEKNRNSKTPIVARITKTITSGQTVYTLPHTVGSVYGIYKLSDSGTGYKVFYDSRSRHNPLGRGMWIEGNSLYIQSTDMFNIGTELTIEYIPNGVARLHNGTCTLNADGTVVTFGATPNAGDLDTHIEAYAGSVFRLLKIDGTVITGNNMQEVPVTTYDADTRQATLAVALDPIPTTDDGNIYYEVAPAISKGMDMVVATYASYRMEMKEGNRKRAAGLLDAFKNERRNVNLLEFYSYMPDAPLNRSDSHDNRRYARRY